MGRSPNTPPFAFPAPTKDPAQHPSPDAPHPLRPPYRARTEGPRPGPNSRASPAAFP